MKSHKSLWFFRKVKLLCVPKLDFRNQNKRWSQNILRTYWPICSYTLAEEMFMMNNNMIYYYMIFSYIIFGKCIPALAVYRGRNRPRNVASWQSLAQTPVSPSTMPRFLSLLGCIAQITSKNSSFVVKGDRMSPPLNVINQKLLYCKENRCC